MSYGGFNPGKGSSELPFVNTNMRSRTGSVSSVHSNQGSPYPPPQPQQQQTLSGSRPGTPGGDGYFPNAGGYGGSGYDGYNSGSSSPASASSYHSPTPPIPIQQHHQHGFGPGGHGFDPLGDLQQIPLNSSGYSNRHTRSHSNASETSLNMDEDLHYSPGSSASSSRRGSVSDSGGGFFNRKSRGRTFRPEPHQSPEDYQSDLDSIASDPDDRYRKKGSGGGGGKRVGVKDIFNDWDLLLPSTDSYGNRGDDFEDDDGLNDDEKRKRQQLVKKGWESSRGQAILISLLVTVAVFVRIWKLAVPSAVVHDEQHFGGFAADYIKGEFYMDVHPPLGKMLFATVAYLLGFDGKFSFTPGKLYPQTVPFIGMRMFAVACGVGLIPISYLTIKRSGHSTQAAIICAVLVTFENALITQSRFILLDAPMMLFMGYTLLAWINFYNHRNRPFTRGWWLWLLQTGTGLFLSSSVKWVGLFTIATIGVCVLKYLQEARTHLYVSTRNFSKQFVALFVCLLVYPAVMYVCLLALDFYLLPNSGSGNAWVSPQFQMTLKNHDVEPVMADIAWESKVHIRHANTNGGWVHSMPGEYTRDGAYDQAIQLVEWDDELTCWLVFPADPLLREQHAIKKEARKEDPTLEFEGYIYDGDHIRLRHCYSKVALATNDLASVGSNKTFIREVRGIKWLKNPTQDTVWKLELVAEGLIPGLADDYGIRPDSGVKDKKGSDEDHGLKSSELKEEPIVPTRDQNKQWHSIKGFRLFNEELNCYLQSHKVFRSPYSTYQEVGCIQGGRQKANTIFIVDQNVNSHLPKSTPSLTYSPLSFFQKFLEMNRVMWWTHHDLSSPIHGEDQYGQSRTDESRPWTWPFMKRGLNYYSSKETNHYIHLMGNPLLWWAASSAVILYIASCVSGAYTFIKVKSPPIKVERDRFGITPFYSVASGTFFAGWAIHYAPFFFMSRQLYLHHYLPALYFSILLLVSRVDRFWQKWPKHVRYSAGLALMGTIILSWFVFSPLAYGSDFGSKAQCERLRILGSWKFTCQRLDLPWARPHSARAVSDEIRAKGIEQDSDVPHFYAEDNHSFDGVEGDVDEHRSSKQEHHEEDALPELTEAQKRETRALIDKQVKLTRAAEARAKEIDEKNALIAEKKALEHKQRELEERLLAQERLLEEQRIVQENIQRDREAAQGQQRQGQQQGQQQQEDAQYEEQRQRVLQAMADKHAESQGASHMVSDATREALEEQIRLLQAQLEGSRG
ncbi:hypothetical protein CPC16_006840 [Podila verticillata]|nr:hypothetical protein CPC16_006840 [Podila verticillata]